MNTFSKLFGSVICSSRDCTVLQSADAPVHARALDSGDGSRDLSFPLRQQLAGNMRGLPTGFGGAGGGQQRGKGCPLLPGLMGHPLPSVLLASVGSDCVAFHAPHGTSGHVVAQRCSYKRQR